MSKKQELHSLAVKARQQAYAPYSQHKIGAAVLLADGSVFSGCNIENASFGATVCAERVAVWKAHSEKNPLRITAICVVSDSPEPWPPCGLCRQVLAEFSTPETEVLVGNLKGIHKSYKFKELLPEAFTPKFLGK